MSWQRFVATNKPDTCIWCGRKLRRPSTVKHGTIVNGKWMPYDEPIREYLHDKRGDYGDGLFCGLRCGYQFGEAMGNYGRRLQPKETP